MIWFPTMWLFLSQSFSQLEMMMVAAVVILRGPDVQRQRLSETSQSIQSFISTYNTLQYIGY